MNGIGAISAYDNWKLQSPEDDDDEDWGDDEEDEDEGEDR